MTLPFTSDAFFQIFADYNRSVWPGVVVFWLSCAALLWAVWRRPERSAWMTLFLSLLWVWNAAVYHAWFFTRINPAAWLFAAVFAVQAAALLIVGHRGRLEYLAASGVRQIVGVTLAIYALAYPFLTQAFGHSYPAAPTFAVPCPTDILTMGLLLTVRGRIPLSLAIIPVLWGFVGGSAAIVLNVPTDFVLLAAAVLLPAAIVVQRTRRGAGQDYERHHEEKTVVTESAESIFAFVDDHERFTSHMMQSSWMMGGGKMSVNFDEGHGRAVGSHIRMGGTMLGLTLSLDEVVTARLPPLLKEWVTVGFPRLLVIGHYRMGVRIAPDGARSAVTVFIDYNLPNGWQRWLGIAFGGFYARWCVQQMLRGIAAGTGSTRSTVASLAADDRAAYSLRGAVPRAPREAAEEPRRRPV